MKLTIEFLRKQTLPFTAYELEYEWTEDDQIKSITLAERVITKIVSDEVTISNPKGKWYQSAIDMFFATPEDAYQATLADVDEEIQSAKERVTYYEKALAAEIELKLALQAKGKL